VCESSSHIQRALSLISIFAQINIGVRAATLRRHDYATSQSLQSLTLQCVIKLRLLIRQLHLITTTTGLRLIKEAVVIRDLSIGQWRFLVQWAFLTCHVHRVFAPWLILVLEHASHDELSRHELLTLDRWLKVANFCFEGLKGRLRWCLGVNNIPPTQLITVFTITWGKLIPYSLLLVVLRQVSCLWLLTMSYDTEDQRCGLRENRKKVHDDEKDSVVDDCLVREVLVPLSCQIEPIK